jgi:hypothetical protein
MSTYEVGSGLGRLRSTTAIVANHRKLLLARRIKIPNFLATLPRGIMIDGATTGVLGALQDADARVLPPLS